jgi:hypothetical protein
MANVTSISTGAALGASKISMDNNRRVFNFGDRVAELAPQQSPFFVYLSKVAKKATDDPVFKFLEQRHQWQRRNFTVHTTVGSATYTADGAADSDIFKLECGYDANGKIAANSQPQFLLEGQVIAIKADDGTVNNFKISGTPDTSTPGEVEIDVIPLNTHTAVYTAGAEGQVIGSAFAEGTGAPSGWEDSLSDSEGYTQIFKTAMNLFSGTAMATGYRGIKDEYKRVWTEKLMEHKMDLEQAFLFGLGGTNIAATPTVDASLRYTHGIVPYTESNGKVYNMSYASSGYDAFLDAMEDFFALEGGNSGNKLVLASRKVITYLNKLGAGSFMNNSVGSSQYRLDVTNVPGAFGHQVTMVNTIFGNLHFVAEPLLRGPWEDYCVAIDMGNVAYRPLVGNGISRDTFIETNIQGNDEDGRKDQIITEAGLEISLPETHAILKFS